MEKVKRVLNRIRVMYWVNRLIPVLTVVVLAVVAFAALRVPGATNVRTISVSGECLTTAPRDRTAITLRVTTLDKSAATSMRTATKIVSEITEYAKSLDAEMQTTDFNSYEKTEWNQEAKKSVTLGTETNIAVEISAKNIDTIEAVLSKFAGRENVYSENLRTFTSAAVMKKTMEECLDTATKNARDRAAALAGGAGHRVGRMVSASYGAAAPQYSIPTANFMVGRAKMAMADTAIEASGTIMAKDTELSVTVSAVFEIR